MTITITVPLTLDTPHRKLPVVATIEYEWTASEPDWQAVEFFIDGKHFTAANEPRFPTLCEMARQPGPAAVILEAILDNDYERSAAEQDIDAGAPGYNPQVSLKGRDAA